MNTQTTLLLTLSLLVYGDTFTMSGKKQQTSKGDKHNQTADAHAKLWPTPQEATKATKQKTKLTEAEAQEAKQTAAWQKKFESVVIAIQTHPGLKVTLAEARALEHPKEYKESVVPSIPGAFNSLKPLPAQPAVAVDTLWLPTVDETPAQEAIAEAPEVSPADEMPAYSPEQIEALKAKIAAFNEKRAAQEIAQVASTTTTEPETTTVAIEIVPTTPAQVATTSTKPAYITSWMKTMCLRSTNLAKAIYFMKNTENRNLATRKEIGSRLGDAITETVAELNKIHALCYGKSEIQSADEIDRLQEPLVQALTDALNLAILPEEGEKQIQVDTGMLKLAAETLQKLNRHEKNQATRVVQAATGRAAQHKKLGFLIQANMESRGDHSLDGELSDNEYDNTLDMLNIVAERTLEADTQTE